MQCLYPVQDPKLGLRPCGQCAHCMVVKHMQWKFRLTQEVLASDLALWLTLQYDDEHLHLLDGVPVVNILDCQNFFRKLRKQLKVNFNNEITFKYFLVSELGPKTLRPHYHVLLLFKMPFMEIERLLQVRQALYEQCKERWYHGHCEEKLFHRGVIKYLTKYVFKPYKDFSPPLPLFRLISNGIGEDYLFKIKPDQVLSSGWKTPEGILPRYYRDKLFPTGKASSYFWNVEKRWSARLVRSDEQQRKLNQELRKFDNLQDYIKYQNYLLRCQRRAIERKEKQKYG